MIIDDADLDNFVSEETLNTHCFSKSVYIKKDAISALEFLTELTTNQEQPFPEVIFIDINMPVMDGFQFITVLKKRLADHTPDFNPKLVILTSSVFIDDQHKAKENFEDIIFVIKPLTDKSLKLI